MTPPIPRILHFVWVGGVMPPLYASWVEGWRSLHPDWDVVVWGEDELAAFGLRNQSLIDAAYRIAPGSVGQFVSDVARYEIVHRHGGIYLDCDFEPRKSLDCLLGDEWAAWETDGHWLANGCFGAAVGSEWLESLITALPENVAAKRGRRPNHLSGPRFYTPITLQHGISCLPSTAFCPYRWDELGRGGEDFPGSFGVHHWNNQRVKQGVPL